MAANPSDPELQGEACTALTNLSHNCDRNRRLVVEGGGLILILNAMQARAPPLPHPTMLDTIDTIRPVARLVRFLPFPDGTSQP